MMRWQPWNGDRSGDEAFGVWWHKGGGGSGGGGCQCDREIPTPIEHRQVHTKGRQTPAKHREFPV